MAKAGTGASANGVYEFDFRRLGSERPGPLDQRFPLQRFRRHGLVDQFRTQGTSFLVGPKPKTGVYIDSSGNPNAFKNAQTIAVRMSLALTRPADR